MAVGISPLVGWWVDRYGSAIVVAAGGVITGGCAIGLSLISHPAAFYGLYIPGRMAFASPLELGPATSLSNWFVRRRAAVLGWLGVTHGTGLTIMPFVAQLLIQGYDWKTAWWVLGAYTLSIAVAPALLLVTRRPEDMGIEPDLEPDSTDQGQSPAATTSPTRVGEEPEYTLRQALYTRAFWSLAAFSAAGFMVQAGVSLHQAGTLFGKRHKRGGGRGHRQRICFLPGARRPLLGLLVEAHTGQVSDCPRRGWWWDWARWEPLTAARWQRGSLQPACWGPVWEDFTHCCASPGPTTTDGVTWAASVESRSPSKSPVRLAAR